MKTLLLSTCLFAAATSALAQGQLVFANNAAQTITNPCTGPASIQTQVGLYVGNVGDSVGSLTLIGNVTNCFAPGRFNGGTRTLTGWTGTVQLQVRAWLSTTVYPSYEAAFAGGLGGDGGVSLGVSAPFSYALTVPPTPPVSIGNAGLTPIILSCPEPSSYALGLLGLACLAFLRRRR